MRPLTQRLLATLPSLDRQIWILIVGRLLSQVGTGFTLFYAPIFFANQVGLSAAAVGFGIGSGSITGVVGRIMGGSFADSPRWGRRKTLLLSAIVSTIADLALTFSYDFTTFLIGNLLMGLGIGLYWPATETVVADLTTLDQRNEAFALNRLADSVGLGLGVILGGWLIAVTGNYRALFAIDGLSYVIFFAIIYGAIQETLSPHQTEKQVGQGWKLALSDRLLLTFVPVNILFTTYLALVNSALPLYFTNFMHANADANAQSQGFNSATLSALFSWHIVLAALCQLPIARRLSRISQPRALMVAAGFWAIGFLLIWATGVLGDGFSALVWAILGLGVMAIAMVAYNPAASSLVVGLAPASLRGIYLSINSLCWAAGYFVGPTIGGWAMDHTEAIAHGFWLATIVTVGVAVVILQRLDRSLRTPE